MAEVAGTLILTRRDIAALMHPADYLQAVELGFRAAAEGKAQAPPPMAIEGVGGAFHAKGARLQLDRLWVALKLNGNFPTNPAERGLPTIQGAILLCDGETGALLAVMDSAEVTLRRTAAATALAARYLARPQSDTILVCGCGEQGAAQLAALAEVLPLRHCLLWDIAHDKAEALARRVGRSGALAAQAVRDFAPAAARSDVIVTCTTARRPFLDVRHVPPGAFVAAVGADSPEKSEIAPALMRRTTLVADVLGQCELMGDLRHALAAGAVRRDDVHAELAELVTGARPGRTREEEITVFDSTGSALQDVASAVAILEKARLAPGRLSVALAAA